jgi:hypothetical protein
MSTLAWQRVRLIAVYTLREALRQRAFGLLRVVALVFAVGARGLRDLNFGASELKFTADLGLGALSLFGSLLAIVGTVQTVFAEVEHRTLQLIFARPVSRREFVVGKLAGMQLMLGLFSLLMLLALGLMLRTREIELLPALPGGWPMAVWSVPAAWFLRWRRNGSNAVFWSPCCCCCAASRRVGFMLRSRAFYS